MLVTLVLSCSPACEIFPDQGLNQCLLHRQVDSLPLATREALKVFNEFVTTLLPFHGLFF